MKTKLIIAALLAGVLALLVWAFVPSALDVETALVTQGRFERTVQEDGKTRVRDRYVISAPLTGRLDRLSLKHGDSVQRMAVVALLWPADPALLDARSRAEQAARIGAMEAVLARARANRLRAVVALEQARNELKRTEALARQGFVSPNQNETGRLTMRLREQELESARQEEEAARHELEQSKIVLKQFSPDQNQDQNQNKDQRRLAPVTADLTPAQVAQAQVKKEAGRATPIRAPVSGKVLKIVQQSEATVQAGAALMELGDPSKLEVAVDILTEDAAQIRPGTRVQLANWGGPETLEGRVRLIEPAAFTKVSALGVEEQRVNAIIDITSPVEKWLTLGDGFKVDVRIMVQVVENAIKVPVSALFPTGARSALFVLDNGRARQVEVDVAARNGIEAWVAKGLTPGTRVIIYPDSKLSDGSRVRVR
jgi:HlyD family secretion protein